MYNVGIVGLGHVGRHHVTALQSSTHFQLVAGCDTDQRSFEILESSTRRFASLEDMLAVPDLDIVIVASPNRLHVEHGVAVMEAGKWLVMEKPLAETREEFERFRSMKAELDGKCTLALHAAHGVEVTWFLDECVAGRELRRFDARFYDPYFESGRLLPGARSLGGSWTDSGINALSVICRLVSPKDLAIRDSRMTQIDGTGCREAQGTVDFDFVRAGGSAGSIDTNWTLGRNSKSTMVRLGDGSRYLLDHSGQSVLCCNGGKREPIYTCENLLPRLTNHYVGVFADLAVQVQSGEDNFEYGADLHNILYRAVEWPSPVA